MRPALFLHMQKTAGTSIQEMARACYGNNAVASHGDYVTLHRAGCGQLPFVSGHFGIEFARALMAGRYCFTFLRDPAERLASLYAFCSAQSPTISPLYAIARNVDFKGFLKLALSGEPWLREHLWNHQVWQLAVGYGAESVDGSLTLDRYEPAKLLALAKANLELFDFVGFVETFDHDVPHVFQHLGFPDVQERRSNVSKGRFKVSELPDETLELIDSITQLEQTLYDYAWSRRRRAISENYAQPRAARAPERL